MKYLLFVAIAFATYASSALALEPAEVPEHLQKVAVTVKTNYASGSGTILARKIEGKCYGFVLTAHHVIDDLRRVETRIEDGSEVKEIKYDNVKFTQERVIDGVTVGETTMFCKVIATSPKYDIAVLMCLWPDKFSETDTVPFFKDGLPGVGVEVFHCGSPSGQELGHNSLTDGIIAANGRMFDELPYTQTTAAALPGSSGGMVVLKSNAEYVGMLTLGIRGTDSFNYIVPSDRIIKWAKSVGFEYLVDPSADAPTLEEVFDLPIESNGSYLSRQKKKERLARNGAFLWVIEDCVPVPAVR